MTTVARADCPDFTLKCPDGRDFTIGTCFNWWALNCERCRSIEAEVRANCQQYSCGNPRSVSNWYGRNDGCSAGAVGPAMTNVFGAACGIHDMCYATPGATQSQCDDDFLHNMLKICQFPGVGSVLIGVCAATAGIAYRVVQDHGNTFPEFAATCIAA